MGCGILKECNAFIFKGQSSVNSSTWHTVGLYWVPGHARVRGNEITGKLTRDSSVQKFMGPEPFLRV